MDDGFPAPGWYHRPGAADVLHFWDGERWTDQTRSAGDGGPVGPVAPPPPPIQPSVPPQPIQPAVPPQAQYATPAPPDPLPAQPRYATPAPPADPYASPPPYAPPPQYAPPGAYPAPAGAYPTPYAPAAAPGYGYPPQAYLPSRHDSTFERNRLSFTTMGVVALYLFLAMTTGIVLLGIVPVMMSIRAASRREPFAPFAIGLAVVVVLVGFVLRAH